MLRLLGCMLNVLRVLLMLANSSVRYYEESEAIMSVSSMFGVDSEFGKARVGRYGTKTTGDQTEQYLPMLKKTEWKVGKTTKA